MKQVFIKKTHIARVLKQHIIIDAAHGRSSAFIEKKVFLWDDLLSSNKPKINTRTEKNGNEKLCQGFFEKGGEIKWGEQQQSEVGSYLKIHK